MGQSFFIWNGRDCRSMGVNLRGPVPIVRPEERVRHVEIPGSSGDLTETEGENIYNSYIQTASISVRGGFRVRDVYRWLRGAGYVTFSGEPDRRQAARIIGAVTLNKHSRNLDKWEGDVQFYCQPLKEKLKEEKITLTNNAIIRNEGDVIAKPLYKITASNSNVVISALGDHTPEDNSLVITEVTAGQVIWVDSASMEVWNSDRTETLTEKSVGNFPVLSPGENNFAFYNASSVEIEKRERYL